MKASLDYVGDAGITLKSLSSEIELKAKMVYAIYMVCCFRLLFHRFTNSIY